MACAAFATMARDAVGMLSSAAKKASLTGLVPRGERVDIVSVLAM